MATTEHGIALVEPSEIITHNSINNVSSSVDHALELQASRQIYTVANVAERTALAGTFVPTANRPLYVHRVNAGAGRQLERTINGTTWETIPAEQDTGWVPLTPLDSANFEPWSPGFELMYRRINNVVSVQGRLRSTTPGYIDSTTSRTVGNLPPEARPAQEIWWASVGSSSGGVQSWFRAAINPAGDIGVARYGPGASTTSSLVPIYHTFIVA